MSGETPERAVSLGYFREQLEASGYVVVKATSYRRARERQHIAESREAWEIQRRESVDRWACKAYDDNQRLRERLTFVYGVARAHGATVEELSGEQAGAERCGVRYVREYGPLGVPPGPPAPPHSCSLPAGHNGDHKSVVGFSWAGAER